MDRARQVRLKSSSTASTSSSHDQLDTLTAGFPDESPAVPHNDVRTGPTPSLSGFVSLLENESLCDTYIVTSTNSSIAAHKVVLAAHSAYFRAIFAGASSNFCIENSRSVVRVENIEDDVLRLLLRLMYGGDRLDAFPQESQRMIGRLMDAAAYLSVQCVVEACSTFLSESLRLGNAVEVYLVTGEREEYASVHAKAMEFIVQNFSGILRSWEGVENLWQLSKEDLVHILCGRHRDCVHKGVDVVMALLLWTRCRDDAQQRDDDVEEIVGQLRREMYRDEYGMAVDAIRDMEREAGATLLVSNERMERVAAALFGPDTPRFAGFDVSFAGLGGDGRMGDGAGPSSAADPNAFFSRPSFHGNTIIAVGGIHSGWKALRSTELYDIDSDAWSPGPDMPMDLSFAHACTSSTGDTFIPVSKSTTMLHYNPADQWRTVDLHNSRVTPRASSAAVALGEHIHVLGGRPTNGRDCHPVTLHQCLRSGSWVTLAPMTTPRASMDACVTLDRIWCVGGQSLRQTHDSMEWYEPHHDCWFLSSSKMSTPRKYATVNAFRDQIVIMGGMNDARTRLTSVEAYDPREGRLRELPPLPRALSSAASCVAGHSVYVMGGRVDRHGAETDALWRYDVRGGAWVACAAMGQARSSLTAFVRFR